MQNKFSVITNSSAALNSFYGLLPQAVLVSFLAKGSVGQKTIVNNIHFDIQLQFPHSRGPDCVMVLWEISVKLSYPLKDNSFYLIHSYRISSIRRSKQMESSGRDAIEQFGQQNLTQPLSVTGELWNHTSTPQQQHGPPARQKRHRCSM